MNFTSTITPDFKKERNYGLDVLRALAILSVLNVHSAHFFQPDSIPFKLLTFLNLDGVTLFFVLSGFLVGGILIKLFEKGDVTFKELFNFWIRRWFRTLPNYFLILTILLLLGLHFRTVASFSQVKNYYYFLANFKKAMPDNLFPEAWSLSVEEWFYLIVPVLVFILVNSYHFKLKTSILFTVIVVIIFSTWFRYYRLSHWHGITEDLMDANFRKQVITRLDSIMYGVLGAFLAHYHRAMWKKYRWSLFFIGIFLLYSNYLQYVFGYFGPVYAYVLFFSFQTIGFLCLFPLLTELKSGKGFVYRQVTKLSLISYSAYLINYSIIKYYVIDYLDKKLFGGVALSYLELINYFIFWLLTIAGAAFLYNYFEKPFTGLREYAGAKNEKYALNT